MQNFPLQKMICRKQNSTIVLHLASPQWNAAGGAYPLWVTDEEEVGGQDTRGQGPFLRYNPEISSADFNSPRTLHSADSDE